MTILSHDQATWLEVRIKELSIELSKIKNHLGQIDKITSVEKKIDRLKTLLNDLPKEKAFSRVKKHHLYLVK